MGYAYDVWRGRRPARSRPRPNRHDESACAAGTSARFTAKRTITTSRIDARLTRYADEGPSQVLNPNSLPRDRLAGRINTPGTLQAIFANGGLNVTRGHPWDLVERNIASGTWKRENAERAFHHSIDSSPDLERN